MERIRIQKGFVRRKGSPRACGWRRREHSWRGRKGRWRSRRWLPAAGSGVTTLGADEWARRRHGVEVDIGSQNGPYAHAQTPSALHSRTNNPRCLSPRSMISRNYQMFSSLFFTVTQLAYGSLLVSGARHSDSMQTTGYKNKQVGGCDLQHREDSQTFWTKVIRFP